MIPAPDLRLELRHAARRLRRSPGFTIVVALTLAVGIGGATTLFSVVHSVLLRPLPFPEPDRLVRVFETNRELSIDQTESASGNLTEWRKRAQGFSALAGWSVTGRTLQTDGGVEVLRAAQVTEDFFPVLRVQAALGRTATAEETARSVFNTVNAPAGTDLVTVISHRLWQWNFGGNPGVVGQTVMIDRKPWKVIGVMPSSFQFPSPDVDVWLPWAFRQPPPHDQRYVRAIGRLANDATLSQAESELQSVAAQLSSELPATNKGWSVKLAPLQEVLTGNSRATLWLLFAAVCCVLLIGCANVAHLQWIRAAQFQQETAVRLALGASPGRLLQQFGAESALLAAAGGAGGVLLAFAAVEWLRAAQPAQLPRVSEVSVHPLALVFAGVVTLGAAALAGLAPLWGSRNTDLAPALREGTRNSTTSRAAHHMRNSLVVAEVAVAVLLLVFAGLLGRSLQQLLAVEPGFQARNVLVLPIFLDNNTYTAGARVRAYYAELFGKLGALPGVVSVGGATALPASGLGPDFERPVWAEGTQISAADAMRADVRIVTPDYFRTLQIPVLRGRSFGAEDTPESPRVLIVNELLANRTWPGEDAVGKQLVVQYSTGTYPYLVVGVVGNVRFYGLRSEPQPELFFPHAHRPYLIMNVTLRTAGDPRPLIPAVRRAALEIDPGLPPQSVKPLEDLLRDTVAQDRLATALFAAFSGVALFLAMLGIYGVIAYRTAQRTNEIGIRIALGAEPQTIVRMVIASGVSLAAMGAMAGLFLAAASARWVESLLFGVAPFDAAAFIAATVAILGVAIAACWIPARRAARVDPVEALRHT